MCKKAVSRWQSKGQVLVKLQTLVMRTNGRDRASIVHQRTLITFNVVTKHNSKPKGFQGHCFCLFFLFYIQMYGINMYSPMSHLRTLHKEVHEYSESPRPSPNLSGPVYGGDEPWQPQPQEHVDGVTSVHVADGAVRIPLHFRRLSTRERVRHTGEQKRK